MWGTSVSPLGPTRSEAGTLGERGCSEGAQEARWRSGMAARSRVEETAASGAERWLALQGEG